MNELLNINIVILCLGLAAFTFIIRTAVELNSNASKSRFWQKGILPVLPIVLGSIVGFFGTAIPYPIDLSNNTQGRVLYGMVAGMLSSVVFRAVKGFLNRNNSNDGAIAPEERSDDNNIQS